MLYSSANTTMCCKTITGRQIVLTKFVHNVKTCTACVDFIWHMNIHIAIPAIYAIDSVKITVYLLNTHVMKMIYYLFPMRTIKDVNPIPNALYLKHIF